MVNGQSLQRWAKLYAETVFIQLVHAIVYTVLVKGAFEAFDLQSGNGNFVLYIICVLFLFKAEKLVKGLFNVRSTGNTIGDYANAGAQSLAMADQAKQIFSRNSTKKVDEDAQDEKKLDDEVKQNRETSNVRISSSTTGALSAGNNISAAVSGGGNLGVAPPTNINGSGLNSSRNNQDALPDEQRSDDSIGSVMPEIRKAAAVLQREALRSKNGKGSGKHALVKHAAGALLRNTLGFTLGAASAGLGALAGIAFGGNPTSAIRGAAMMKQIGGLAFNGATNIVGVAQGKFQSLVMRDKFLSGGYDDILEREGVDLDALYQHKKADLIREALAEQIEGTRSGGTSKGEVKFTYSIDK